MPNPLVELRALVAPPAKQRRGVVARLADGRADVTWTGGGTASVLCGVTVAVGDTVLVVGGAVAAKVPKETTKIVQIL